ncbi:MAG: WD40/YVTN/BNR-like repeat-containing protein [Gemmatimonadaceae bacterium]
MTQKLSLRSSATLIALTGAFVFRPADFAPPATTVDPQLFAGLTWRNLGPFRGGRVAAVTGVIGQPGVFYAGYPAGGVWKTTSAGETWYPIFDDVKEVSSVGAIEVAPSDPNVIYVGTGDMGGINTGNGVYKSTDAGRSWRHVGLDDTKQIPSMLVDVRNPNIVLVAAQGDLTTNSPARGVFRTTDGGVTWTKTLYADDTTGIQKLARAFDVPSVIFATTVRHYAPSRPPQPPQPDTGRTQTRVFKSTDAGVTWQEMTGGGLPRLTGRTSIAVAMHTNAQRVFLISNTGLYRSDDGGATWRQMAADDQRIRNGQGGYNCGVYVDPGNPDIVYTVNTASYKSVDGGKTFTGFKGAPGGDDPQQVWIDPTNGQRIFMGYDQGAIVSLDGGATWSSWYNQSTEQMYHLSIDNSFPAWIYGTQQDAGAIRTRIRGNLGEITPLDWNPVNGWEWGTIVADPLDPNTVYSSGFGIDKISIGSDQWINVSPNNDPAVRLRTTNSQPLVFAPWNQHMILTGFQMLMSSTDGGVHWTPLSPDLTIPKSFAAQPAPAPGAPGSFPSPANFGAIESISASTAAQGLIWVGTNTGLIKVTRDGGANWEDATIPDLAYPKTRANILTIEASHFDPGTAYAAVAMSNAGDYAPYLYRTRDYGHTWTKIIDGLPTNQANGSFVRVVRNDTKKQGLLFAGTESGMYVSFDDGDHWQSLMENLPTTSYRDIAFKDDEIVVATYGRGLWALDDYSMLRQLTPAVSREAAHLFKPGDAVRLRRNTGQDTPFPPEVPHALNPLDGVIIDYWLAKAPTKEITLDVLDASGAPVRHMSSAVPTPVPEAARPPEPNFWIAPPFSIPARAGTNRTHWDLRYDAPPSPTHTFEINANPGLTPPSPLGPLVVPGVYTLKLSVDGKSYTQTVSVRADPRSPASAAALQSQHELQMRITDGIRESYAGWQLAGALRSALVAAVPSNAAQQMADLSALATTYSAQLDTVGGLDTTRARGRGAQSSAPNFRSINRSLVGLLNSQETGDMAPTPAMLAAYTKTCTDLAAAVTAWQKLASTNLTEFNTALTRRKIKVLAAPTGVLRPPSCS